MSERYCSSVPGCVPVSATASRQHMYSAASHQLVVLSYRLSSYGRRAFSVAGPMMWNSLLKVETVAWSCPHHLRVCMFTEHFFSLSTSAYSALGAVSSALMYYINLRFTYFTLLLTYLLLLNNQTVNNQDRNKKQTYLTKAQLTKISKQS